MDYREFFTDDMTRRIYNELLDNDNNEGQLPFPDFKLN